MNKPVVIDSSNNILYISWDMKSYEDAGSCGYDRTYKLIPLHKLEKGASYTKEELEKLIVTRSVGGTTNPIKETFLSDIIVNETFTFKI
jgi:hypothetical protein